MYMYIYDIKAKVYGANIHNKIQKTIKNTQIYHKENNHVTKKKLSQKNANDAKTANFHKYKTC